MTFLTPKPSLQCSFFLATAPDLELEPRSHSANSQEFDVQLTQSP